MASLDVTNLVSSAYKSKLLSAKMPPRSSIAEASNFSHLAETFFVLLKMDHDVRMQIRSLLHWPHILLKV